MSALVPMQFGHGTLLAEVACTPAQRLRGLMGRAALARDRAMLLCYPGEIAIPLWAKHTLIPLSVAFLDRGGVVVDQVDLQPHDETVRTSKRPAQYALETNQGWFGEHGVCVGDMALFSLPKEIAIT